MSDTTPQPAAGNTLDQLAAHADDVASAPDNPLTPDEHTGALRELEHKYRVLLTEAADHFNRARDRIDHRLNEWRNTQTG